MTRSKILAIALFVSLAVNLFLGAGLLRSVVHHSPRHHGPDKAQFEALSQQTQTAMKALWHDNHGAMRKNFQQVRAARDAVKQALIADQYDEQAVITAQMQLDQAHQAARDAINQSVLTSARLMSDAERQAFFAKGFRHRHRGLHHHRPPPSPTP